MKVMAASLYSSWQIYDLFVSDNCYYKYTTDSTMETKPMDMIWFNSSIQLPLFQDFIKFAIWPASNLVKQWTLLTFNHSLYFLDFQPLLSSLNICKFSASFPQQMDYSALQPWLHVCCFQIFGWFQGCRMHSVLLKTKVSERAYQCFGCFL